MAKAKSKKKKAKPACTADEFSVINVRIGTCPGKVENYILNGDRTLECALRTAGLDPDQYQIRVNLDPVDLSYELKEGDEVLACPPVQGS